MYHDGEGTTRNYKTAYIWYYLSKLSGYDADVLLTVTEKTLSPADIEDAKRQAQQIFNEIQNRQ